MATKTAIIAGGGTGGHIYPGLAVARALQSIDAEIQIHFVGSTSGLEGKIIPKEGFPLHLLQIGKLNLNNGLLGKLVTLLRIPMTLFKAWQLLRQIRPEVVLGVGGYASGPMVLVAALFRYKTAIWEPNAHAGLTNRLLSRFVKKAYIVFDETRSDLKSKHCLKLGIPVRKELEGLQSTENTTGQLRVLVFGGSQGARGINLVLRDSIKRKVSWLNRVDLVHQTGRHDFQEISEVYTHEGSSAQVFEFLYDMDARYKWADLVICRAGASTLAELAACGKAAILVPFPFAADDHQLKNALALTKADAAILIEQKNLTVESLAQSIEELLADPGRLLSIRKNIRQFYIAESANKIAKDMLGI